MPSTGEPFTTYIEPRDAEALRALARAEDRSVAATIRRAVLAHIKANTSESPAGQPDSRDNSGSGAAGHVSPGV
jgi:hypothetical protein